MVKRPNLALLLSGTPAMLPRLIPSTENGLFSRILMYRIPGSGTYRPLTSADDSPAASEYFESWGQRVLDIGVFLDNSPTWVKFSDAQRKRLDRFFEREYYNVRSFGNEDMESTVLRYRLAIFRIGTTVRVRKGESGCFGACLDDQRPMISPPPSSRQGLSQPAYLVATSCECFVGSALPGFHTICATCLSPFLILSNALTWSRKRMSVKFQNRLSINSFGNCKKMT